MTTKLNLKLISNTMNPELVIATAGKLCYSPANIEDLMEKQTPEMIEKFVNMLVTMGHESPLEHATFTFAVEGVSRALTHQLVRHRIASYSQQSQRYVKESQFEYVVPEDIKHNSWLAHNYMMHMINTQKTYDMIVDGLICDYTYDTRRYGVYLAEQLTKLKIDGTQFYKWADEHWLCEDFADKLRVQYKSLYAILEKKAIENARYIFPNAIETKIIVTMNLRSLINFCHHRCCRRAQEEINELAWAMADEVAKTSTLLGKCLGASCQFGKCPEGTMTCGQAYEKKR